ncbi:unnamed protein product [Cyprideis torosa]|uniref:Uncharacterized protein n=1 Tax=Cyprideis torosa TaxID=163714 RepID=A0A7R8ZPG6_9CRUS|nr:unnamed protein product [Cyprideis torosa]CAG0900509.1 unnamed protein product [Cyprideis torosa]
MAPKIASTSSLPEKVPKSSQTLSTCCKHVKAMDYLYALFSFATCGLMVRNATPTTLSGKGLRLTLSRDCDPQVFLFIGTLVIGTLVTGEGSRTSAEAWSHSVNRRSAQDGEKPEFKSYQIPSNAIEQQQWFDYLNGQGQGYGSGAYQYSTNILGPYGRRRRDTEEDRVKGVLSMGVTGGPASKTSLYGLEGRGVRIVTPEGKTYFMKVRTM